MLSRLDPPCAAGRMFMRIAGTAAVIAVLGMSDGVSGDQAGIPNSVCRGEDVVIIRNADLKPERYRTTDLYRFAGGNLYISSASREEYLYNEVRETEPGRYTSAHMTIIFHGTDFKNATAVHMDEIQTRVLKLRCVAN
jgi:hypothetical protein